MKKPLCICGHTSVDHIGFFNHCRYGWNSNLTQPCKCETYRPTSSVPPYSEAEELTLP